MSMRPRIEEVEDDDDIDNMDFDPAQFDPRNTIITPADIPSITSSRKGPPIPTPQQRQQFLQQQQQQQQQQQYSSQGSSFIGKDQTETRYITNDDMSSKFKKLQCLYPVYFDITRSRAEGRRVDKEMAVKNPLAREMIPILNMNGFQTIFEPTKTHPKDWANPGRVRVLFKQDGQPTNPKIKHKRQLYALVAEYLKSNPTTAETPLELRLPNQPHPKEPPAPPAVPKGWKINEILPLHSPAVSGGGVSENIFKEMMGELAGQAGGAGGGGGESSAPVVKKEKKKGKK